MMLSVAIVGTTIFVVIVLLLIRSVQKRWKLLEEKVQNPLIQIPAPQVNVNLEPLQKAIEGLPNKVLHSIQSSTNTKKGALGELIGYIELEAQYDRIIPLGNIVDFLAIKLPDVNKIEEGHIDFIDIKTGKRSRLSKDQCALQQLIKDKKINFIKLTVNTTTNEAESQTD